MWIRQPGNAYGPGGKGRTGKNGGARGGFEVYRPPSQGGWSKVPPAASGFVQVHPVPPGFQNTRTLPTAGALHQLVKNVNLQAAIARIRQMTQGRGGGGPVRTIGGSVTDPALLGSGEPPRHRLPYGGGAPLRGMPVPSNVDPRAVRHPLGLAPFRGGGLDWIRNEREQTARAEQLSAGFAANPTLAPTTVIPGLAEAGQFQPPPDPITMGPPPGTDFSGIDTYLQQQLEAQRAAMIARLMRQHGAQ